MIIGSELPDHFAIALREPDRKCDEYRKAKKKFLPHD
jgi:hypothetical protein